jgi:aspartate ammonia-lyase
MNGVNKQELERLASLGAEDSNDDMGTDSIGTTIAASVAYCSPVVSAITKITPATFTASMLFSCASNSKQCS